MPGQQVHIKSPFILKTVNKIGALFQASGLPTVRLDAQQILEQAQTQTGISLTDPVPRAGLETLVRSLNADASLNLFGRFAIRNMLHRSMESRLNVEGAHPSLTDGNLSVILEPVFIIGMPRSGTTILHALLHLDRNHRAPLAWECQLPHPAPRNADYESNARVETVRREFDQLFRLVPDFKKKHYMEADSPQECVGITAMNFISYQYLALAYIPTYYDWFCAADQSHNLRWHRTFLEFLQSGGVVKPRWLLKSPVHMMRLPAVFDVYPDAKVIATHRDPARVVPSTASLISSTRSLYSDDEDALRTGREQLGTWSDYLNRFLVDRQRLAKEDQIVDVQFETFRRDQMSVVDSIYEKFGWELHTEDRTKMQQFLQEQPHGKHGVHEYSLEEFGIGQKEIRTYFGDYMEFIDKTTDAPRSESGGSCSGE